MKKLFFIPVAIVALSLFSCDRDLTQEDVGVGTNKGIEALETLSDTTTVKTDSTKTQP